jgi:hypothetical protein
MGTVDKPSSIAQLFDLPEVPEIPVEKSEHVIRQEVFDGDLY